MIALDCILCVGHAVEYYDSLPIGSSIAITKNVYRFYPALRDFAERLCQIFCCQLGRNVAQSDLITDSFWRCRQHSCSSTRCLSWRRMVRWSMVRSRRRSALWRRWRVCYMCRVMVPWSTLWRHATVNWRSAVWPSRICLRWRPSTMGARVRLVAWSRWRSGLKAWCTSSWRVVGIRIWHHRMRIAPRWCSMHRWIRPTRIVHRSTIHIQRNHARHWTYWWSAGVRIAPNWWWPWIGGVRWWRPSRRRGSCRRACRSASGWWITSVLLILTGLLAICLFFCLLLCAPSARMPSIGIAALPSRSSAPSLIIASALPFDNKVL